MKAQYQCLSCHHHWKEKLKGATQCPKCGYEYVEWLNYLEMEKVWGPDFESKTAYYEKFGAD